MTADTWRTRQTLGMVRFLFANSRQGGDGAIRAVLSPDEARAFLDYLNRHGAALPEWAENWDSESSVWLTD